MSQGTLSLTNGSKDVTGTGTAFTSDAEAGGWLIFHVGGMPFTVAVESVQSDTELTLSDNFDGATATGIGYNGVPLSALIQIPALTSIQARDAIRRMMMNDANFQQLLTGPDDVTINRPDGSTFSGPSWPKIVELLNGVDIDQITALANQISDDAIQVAADKTAAETANSSAQTAKTSAESSATSANASKADAANSASYANSRANAAEASAVRAEQAAESIDTSSFLSKSGNLSGLQNKSEARENIEVDRFSQQFASETWIYGGTGKTKRLVVQESGSWGLYDNTAGYWRPLGVEQGGTGVNSDADMRAKMQNTWLSPTDPSVLEYITWPVGANVSSPALMVRIGPHQIDIKGAIFVDATGPSKVPLFTLKKNLPGYTMMYSPYSPTVSSLSGSGAASAGVASLLAHSSLPASPNVTGLGGASDWTVIDLSIVGAN